MRNIALILTLAAAPLFAQPAASYRVTHTYTLGGDGGWDYIVPDPPNHRLFIGRQDRVVDLGPPTRRARQDPQPLELLVGRRGLDPCVEYLDGGHANRNCPV